MTKSKKELIEEIVSNFQSMRRNFSGEKHSMKELELTPTQMLVLFMVKHHQGMGLTEMAEEHGISKSAMTQSVDSLVKRGYLVKEPSKEDHRAVVITLADSTKKQMEDMREKMFARFSTMFEVLENEELEQLADITKKLKERNTKEGGSV